MKTEKCSVCLEEIEIDKPVAILDQFSQEDVVKLRECGHVYHTVCITEVLEDDKKCPLCRRDISWKTLKELFLDEEEIDNIIIPSNFNNNDYLFKEDDNELDFLKTSIYDDDDNEDDEMFELAGINEQVGKFEEELKKYEHDK